MDSILEGKYVGHEDLQRADAELLRTEVQVKTATREMTINGGKVNGFFRESQHK